VSYPTRARRSKRGGFALPLAAIAGFAPLASYTIADMQGGGLPLVAKGLSWRLTGWNVDANKFDASGLWQGLFPILGGVLVHKIASKLGVNRALAGAGVPFVRI